ncbi:MAG: TetR/AcrR family transcriptional regulator C-terminal domain-containing protein [Pseudonocardia sp.]|nr:TetR/AcrR family transcriptional regulator C-terminal domain-containing protein [Pseudonocardia sp.]
MSVWLTDSAVRPDGLSRDRIVAAAIELADAQVRGDITMRALADRVGARSPMALYRYVGNKDGLSDLMADAMYGLVRVTRGEGWRPALRELGLTGWGAVRAHPWFARLAFSRPPIGPRALDLYDAALAELEPLDLPAATRMGVISTVLGHVFGSGLAVLEEHAMRSASGLHADEDLARSVAPYLERIATAGTHPHFSRWAADLRRNDPAPQTFERILEWLLDGIEDDIADGRP